MASIVRFSRLILACSLERELYNDFLSTAFTRIMIEFDLTVAGRTCPPLVL
jgi:hypothetical protein